MSLNVVLAGGAAEVTEAVMDKGYHDNGLLADCARREVRTYIPERDQKTRRWTDKPEATSHHAAWPGRATAWGLHPHEPIKLNAPHSRYSGCLARHLRAAELVDHHVVG